MNAQTFILRSLGTQDYLSCWQAMQQFTNARTPETPDEIWLLEHEPVFTQGQNGKAEHVLNPGHIPVIQTDRGGQITYHGPGQLMVYLLIDLKRKQFNIRDFVTRLEQSIIDFLATYNIEAIAKRDAPGVYVDGKKICSIGLRVRRGYTYHGIAFNISNDLSPFEGINPCGFTNLKMTRLVDLAGPQEPAENRDKLLNYLMLNLGYTNATTTCLNMNLLEQVNGHQNK